MVILRRPDAPGGSAPSVAPQLDAHQLAAVSSPAARRVVLGAPGTGKTTVAVEAMVAAIEAGLSADRCVLLAPTRLRAAAVRDQVTSRVHGTATEPLARTPQALGFGILRSARALRGDSAPRLLSGPEQDVVIRDLLAGHAAGVSAGPDWPDSVREALPTKGFRNELRDILMRIVELDLQSDDLRVLATRHGRPEWAAVADFYDEYDQLTALSRPGAYDPAWILGAAADELQRDQQLAAMVRDQARLIVVDDAQELTRAGERLLRTIVDDGTQVLLVGDPDTAVQTFRGAEPAGFLRWSQEWPQAERFVLRDGHRNPRAVGEAAARVSSRIGAVGGGEHRLPDAGPRQGRAEVGLFRAVAQESAHIAAVLRRAHVMEGLPWADMAVLARGQGRLAALRRALAAAGVPATVPATVLALRDEPAVRPFLQVFGMARAVVDDQAVTVEAEHVVDLLTSPLGGADALLLRRLRRELRRAELADGGSRTSDELLVAAVTEGFDLAVVGAEALPARRVAAVLRAAVRQWRVEGADAEAVLWAMWQAAGLASLWEETALSGGAAGERADHDLDAIVALFAAAAAYVDRLPGASPAGFLDHVLGQEVPGDRLVAAAPDTDTVSLLTPAAAAGRQWPLVVVAGVQEGVWPDLRLRGSLLGSQALVDTVTGRPDSLRAAAAAVRYDETRQFLVAITRASDRLLVTAVRSEDEQPSAYLDLVDPLAPQAGSDPDRLRPFTEVGRQMTLPAAVAELRREAVAAIRSGHDDQTAHEDRLDPTQAARLLGWLSREQVPGADPRRWWAFTELTDDRPRRALEATVPVSPSKVGGFGECGLKWLLTACGADGPQLGAPGIGTLIHEVAAEFPHQDQSDERHAALDERWGRLGFGDGWMSKRRQQDAHTSLERFDRYLSEADAQGWELDEAETTIQVTVGRVALRGQADRIERRADQVRIIDLKVTSSKPPQAELERYPQLGAYQWAIEHGAVPGTAHSGGAALLQLGSGAKTKGVDLQVQAPLDQQAEPEWAQQLLDDTAEGMGAATFTATRGKACQLCPVRRSCPLQPEGAVV